MCIPIVLFEAACFQLFANIDTLKCFKVDQMEAILKITLAIEFRALWWTLKNRKTFRQAY